MHTAMRLSVDAANEVRRTHPSLSIAFYGLYAAMSADRIVGDLADRVIAGEYEDGLAAWAGSPHDDLDPVRIDLSRQRFRVPARTLLPPLDRYARLQLGDEMRLAGYVEASHGCRHRCRHCPIPAIYDGRFRVTGLETVLGDVHQLVALGAQHVTFGDPDFLNAPRYALDVITAVHDSFPELTFDITVKVEHILKLPEIWAGLARLNVLFVVSAFETTNDRVLTILDKGHTYADLGKAVRALRDVGIHVRPSWLPFTPWTQKADVMSIMTFLDEHDLMGSLDPIQLSIRLLVPEGSLLLDQPEMKRHLTGYDADSLSYRWQAEDPAMDVLQADLAAIAEEFGDRKNEALEAMWNRVMGDRKHRRWTAGAVPGLTEAWFCCAEPTSQQRQMVSLSRVTG
jgi:hypothetical protein